jgi:hypothetical protein
MKLLNLTEPITVRWSFIFTCSAILLVLLIFSFLLPVNADFHQAYRPAALELLAGRSPYTVDAFFNPPWALIPMIPLSLLSERFGNALLLTANFIIYVFIAFHLKVKPLTFVLFLSLPYVWFSANVDAWVALGFLLPPQIGLFLVLLKPQIGFPVAFFWLIQSWSSGGLREVVRVFSPVSVSFLASLILFGPWLLRGSDLLKRDYNIALFPYLVPLGLVMLYWSTRGRNKRLAVLSAPFLAPYIGFYSLPALILHLPDRALLLTCAILWIYDLFVGKFFWFAYYNFG